MVSRLHYFRLCDPAGNPRRMAIAVTTVAALIGLTFAVSVSSDHSSSNSGATGGVPHRIVSMNPCVDAVLVEIATQHQIAAISHYSHDPRATSLPLAQAQQYPVVFDEAEDIIAAKPDFVIAGPHVARPTLAALTRIGIPVMEVPVPQSVAESEAQITQIAARIGRRAAGAALNQRIERALDAATSHDRRRIPALIWQSSGLVPGRGTLVDDLLNRTGFRNISADIGLAQWDQLPLESLLAHPPSVLFTGIANMDVGQSDANRMLNHPALRMAAARFHVTDYPSGLLHCGGPVIIRAAGRLSSVRAQILGAAS